MVSEDSEEAPLSLRWQLSRAFSFDVREYVAAGLAPGQRLAYFLPRPFLLIVRTGRIVTN